MNEIMKNMKVAYEVFVRQADRFIAAAKLKDDDAEYMQKLDADHNKITLQNNHD
jgi:hypothetical protein